ncbi:large conductance mechanosensitive channel protein MscL [Eubacterium sp. 1001713B170207_170306_E7]|uniref:large conductance mechanosensitive channel protein MscL n=1 Tax=Eubacterium sp. 1001713B170207_170306_E7 TaxID=2787097 RepID=UPI00189B7143|nr:large conductance mechanosensitive channel protein MscL [Eubacterium sp. 1001713B170207_170306_E7]
MKNLLKEFKEFALRGNVMELAVAVIMGAAFQGIISSLTGDIISPILGLFGGVDFSNLAVNIGDASIRYGAFITAVINFLIMAFVIFLMVKGMNKLAGLRKTKESDEEEKTKTCPYCFTEIPKKAVRCPHCTTVLVKRKKQTSAEIQRKD